MSHRTGSELSSAFARCRSALLGIGLFTALLNVLYLTGPFFMLEIYDRVVPSRSIPTLVGLCVLAAILFAFQALLDIVRNRVLVRMAGLLADSLGPRTHQIAVTLPLREEGVHGAEPMRDLDQVRSFLSSSGPAAFFDLPWIPLYLFICFLFHPWIGATATAGAIILIGLTIATEFLARAPTRDVGVLSQENNAFAEASRRNAEVLRALGMVGRFGALWAERSRSYLAAQQRASDVIGGLGGLSRVMRTVLQSAVLAVGAYLVINQQASAGIIIAGSILTSRALAPVELAISQWKGFAAARRSWSRLDDTLRRMPPDPVPLQLPKPSAALAVEALSVAPPGGQRLVVLDVAFRLKAGQGLGIIGPSASGKSTLARALVGVWQAARGQVRLDGAVLDQWSPDELGAYIGYLPQDLELFAGTVGENIARFDEAATAGRILAAAQAAGVHDMVLGLANGYDTEIGDDGTSLSTGQRQRIGLARALYGDPFLVVLDEPNSSLDRDGDEALTKAILGVRARGGVVIVIAHRPSALAGVDQLLLMAGGRQQKFGPKDTVLRDVMAAPSPAAIEAVAQRVAAHIQDAAS